jgi:hypothetical protein
MSLISQPGSDYQLTEITLDLGRAGGITHLLTDIHGLGRAQGRSWQHPGGAGLLRSAGCGFCARTLVRRRRG